MLPGFILTDTVQVGTILNMLNCCYNWPGVYRTDTLQVYNMNLYMYAVLFYSGDLKVPWHATRWEGD